MALLSVNGISKRENGTFAVKDISFLQQRDEKIAIAGETGSGKTSLLKMIAGLLQPDSGQILFEGKKVPGPFEKLIPGHPRIAYLSQHFELRNNYRVEEELESRNLLSEEEARRIYTVCQVDHLLKRKTDQLSGGERQRIVLARLLTTSPKLLLLDEPFSNLDAIYKNIIKSVISDIGIKLGITCILVSHDAADTLSWADEIIVLKNGEIIQQGKPQQVYRQPVNEYCAGLFGEYNLIDAANEAVLHLPPGTNRNGKQLLIRPENFQLGVAGEKFLCGTVQQILYWGSYHTLEVLVGGQLLRARINSDQFAAGDTVCLTIAAADAWYV